MPVLLTSKSFNDASTPSFNIEFYIDKHVASTASNPNARLIFFKNLILGYKIDARYVILRAIQINDPNLAISLIDFIENERVIIPLEQSSGDELEDPDTNFFAFVASYGYVNVTERLFKHGLDKCIIRHKLEAHTNSPNESDKDIRTSFARRVLEARCVYGKTLQEYLMSVVSPYTLINEGHFKSKTDREPLLNLFKFESNIPENEILYQSAKVRSVSVEYEGITETLDFILAQMIKFDVDVDKASIFKSRTISEAMAEICSGSSKTIVNTVPEWLLIRYVHEENNIKFIGETRREDNKHIQAYRFDLNVFSIIRDNKQAKINLSFKPHSIAKCFNAAKKKQEALRAEKHGDHKALQVANSALSTAVVATEAVKEVQIEVKEVKTEVKQVKAEVQVLSKKVKAIEIRVNNLEAALKEIRKFARAQCQQSDVAIIDELKDRDLISFYTSVRDAINDALRNTLDGVLQQTKFLLAAQTTAGVLELGSNTVGAPGLGAAGKLILFAAYHISVLEAKNKAKVLKEVLSAYDAPKLIAIDVAETLAMQLRKDPEALAKFKANKDRVIAAVVRVVVKKQLGSELKHLVKELGEMAADNQSQLLTGFSSYLKLTAVEENPHTRQSHTYKFKHPQSSAFKGIHGLFKPEKCMLSYLDSNGSAGSSDLSSSGTPENKSQLTSNLRVTPFIAI